MRFFAVLLCCVLCWSVFAYADETEVPLSDETPPISGGEVPEVDDGPSPEPVSPELEEEPLPDEMFPDGDSSSGDTGDDEANPDSDDDIPVDITDESALVLLDIYDLMTASEVFSVDDDQYPETAPLRSGFYIECDTSRLGKVIIYVSKNFQEGCFALDDGGDIVNISGSSVSGVLYRGGSSYQLRWSAWDTPQYRTSSTSSNYEYLRVNEVLNTNVEILDKPVPLYPNERILLMFFCFLGGVIVCKLFLIH